MASTQDIPAAQPHATVEQIEAARHDSKLAQVLYHDWEAENYDDKWSISYDQRCVDYARGRFDAMVPFDEQRNLILPSNDELTPARIARVIAARIARFYHS